LSLNYVYYLAVGIFCGGVCYQIDDLASVVYRETSLWVFSAAGFSFDYYAWRGGDE